MKSSPTNPHIELVVLDIAGTTVDEGGAVYVALASAVAATGYPPAAEALQRWMGTDKRQAITGLLAETTGTTPDDMTVEALYGLFRTRLETSYATRPPTPIGGAPEAMAALRSAGVMVALTTGFARDIAEPLLTGLSWSLAVDDGTGDFDAVVCADDVLAGRPAPYMIFRAMEATGVHDVSCVAVVGDTVADLRAGTNAGAGIVAGVATGALTHAELAKEPHTHLLDSVADLPAVILAAG